ncbi:E-selectin [Balaenoptera acutorostrata]|uniref:E-selectin n=1 Tax=Balaenoptera acutorostrata TaxID=9767 RepID=A0A383ZBM2_BALAC|nr:E-selectin [Balaenoptera acutorostrata]
MIASQFLSALTFALLLFKESGAWSYNASTETLTFDEASAYCQQRYTHLVAIQNQEEIKHLNSAFSYSPSYYWIGIRKVNDTWTWIGTQKPLTEEAANWAPGEPNNKQNKEDCIEIYIKRETDSGKWNDERCSKKKLALCYTAACTPTSCSGHGDCTETINSYTCQCHPGFKGLKCEQVVTCQAQEAPEHGSLVCNHPLGSFSYNSSCSVSCGEGYLPSSTEVTQCTSSGEWSVPLPACNVAKCDALTNPVNGVVKCFQSHGSFLWNTTCEFECHEGYKLTGPQHLQCISSGIWDNKKPTCKAVTCDAIRHPQNGTVSCSHSPAGEFTYKSSCHFACVEGFVLQGPAQVECTTQGQWTQQVPVCEAVKCDAVSQPRSGSVNCTHSPTGEFTYKSSCAISCEEGFELHGSAQLECTSQGQWTHEVPSCQVVQCSSLEVPGKIDINCSGEPVFGSRCTFACPEGWTLKGSAALTCGATGHWSGMMPTCEAPPESQTPLAVGLSAAGISLMTLASFLFWLLKRLQKKAKKFVPASSCQSLQSDGSYQTLSELI